MSFELNREFIADTLAQPVLDPRTRALYELCHMQRGHRGQEIVTDKLRLAARLYAEQTGRSELEGFSAESVAHRLHLSGVDQWFSRLATAEHLEHNLALDIQQRFMDLFADLSVVTARALSTRYLHFHFPEVFPIHDPEVERVAFRLCHEAPAVTAEAGQDPVYARFYACCQRLVEELAPLCGHRLNPQELDRLLRAWPEHGTLAANELAVAEA